MLVSLWSLKGGSGLSVTSALIALRRAERDPAGAVLVDLCGDQHLILGCPPPVDEGVTDWLASRRRSPATLIQLGTEAAPGLRLIGAGRRGWDGLQSPDDLVAALASHPGPVVVDAGCLVGDGPSVPVGRLLAMESVRSILVTRACYLALARVPAMPVVPSGIVLLRERYRALASIDVEAAVGAPVIAHVEVDADIARAVDAGLLIGRRPRGLGRVLDAVA